MYRKILFFTLLFLLVLPGLTLADSFQFVHRATGANVAYSPVYVNNNLVGNTDLYGRILINLQPGNYNFAITFRGQTFRITLTVTGNRQLQVINL